MHYILFKMYPRLTMRLMIFNKTHRIFVNYTVIFGRLTIYKVDESRYEIDLFSHKHYHAYLALIEA